MAKDALGHAENFEPLRNLLRRATNGRGCSASGETGFPQPFSAAAAAQRGNGRPRHSRDPCDRHRWWRFLRREWLTSVDHKRARPGMLLRGFFRCNHDAQPAGARNRRRRR